MNKQDTPATDLLRKHLGDEQVKQLFENNEPLWDDIVSAMHEALNIRPEITEYPSKELLINSISRRIRSEYRKHSNLDWPLIAAKKIVGQWFSSRISEQPNPDYIKRSDVVEAIEGMITERQVYLKAVKSLGGRLLHSEYEIELLQKLLTKFKGDEKD